MRSTLLRPAGHTGETTPFPRRFPFLFAAVSLLLALQACGGDSSPAGPSPNPGPGAAPTVTSIAPARGSTAGGTAVTVTGTNFIAGASVTMGGAAASEVTVASATTVTARTPQHAAGAVDVVVTVGSRSGRLSGGFTYEVPAQTANQPPVIDSITVQGPRPRQPANFADLNEEVNVTAAVTDAETAADQLTYEWTANAGTFTDSGRAVTWRAPSGVSTPFEATLTLTVIESYQGVGADGLPAMLEHRVTKTALVRVHDSVKEVGAMATLFLENFSDSSVPVDVVMRDFTSSCSAAEQERDDVRDNRCRFEITDSDVGPASVTVGFGGTCEFRNRPGDACSSSDVEWQSVEQTDPPASCPANDEPGEPTHVRGVDHIAAVYRQGRWWLCSSDFDGIALTSSGRRVLFMR